MNIQTYESLSDLERMEIGLSQARAASVGATVISGAIAKGESASIIETLKRVSQTQQEPNADLTLKDLRQIMKGVDQVLENLDRV